MKRAKLERHGGNRDIWVNPTTGADVPIPRHAEAKQWTARGICRHLEVEPPPGE